MQQNRQPGSAGSARATPQRSPLQQRAAQATPSRSPHSSKPAYSPSIGASDFANSSSSDSDADYSRSYESDNPLDRSGMLDSSELNELIATASALSGLGQNPATRGSKLEQRMQEIQKQAANQQHQQQRKENSGAAPSSTSPSAAGHSASEMQSKLASERRVLGDLISKLTQLQDQAQQLRAMSQLSRDAQQEMDQVVSESRRHAADQLEEGGSDAEADNYRESDEQDEEEEEEEDYELPNESPEEREAAEYAQRVQQMRPLAAPRQVQPQQQQQERSFSPSPSDSDIEVEIERAAGDSSAGASSDSSSSSAASFNGDSDGSGEGGVAPEDIRELRELEALVESLSREAEAQKRARRVGMSAAQVERDEEEAEEDERMFFAPQQQQQQQQQQQRAQQRQANGARSGRADIHGDEADEEERRERARRQQLHRRATGFDSASPSGRSPLTSASPSPPRVRDLDSKRSSHSSIARLPAKSVPPVPVSRWIGPPNSWPTARGAAAGGPGGGGSGSHVQYSDRPATAVGTVRSAVHAGSIRAQAQAQQQQQQQQLQQQAAAAPQQWQAPTLSALPRPRQTHTASVSSKNSMAVQASDREVSPPPPPPTAASTDSGQLSAASHSSYRPYSRFIGQHSGAQSHENGISEDNDEADEDAYESLDTADEDDEELASVDGSDDAAAAEEERAYRARQLHRQQLHQQHQRQQQLQQQGQRAQSARRATTVDASPLPSDSDSELPYTINHAAAAARRPATAGSRAGPGTAAQFDRPKTARTALPSQHLNGHAPAPTSAEQQLQSQSQTQAQSSSDSQSRTRSFLPSSLSPDDLHAVLAFIGASLYRSTINMSQEQGQRQAARGGDRPSERSSRQQAEQEQAQRTNASADPLRRAQLGGGRLGASAEQRQAAAAAAAAQARPAQHVQRVPRSSAVLQSSVPQRDWRADAAVAVETARRQNVAWQDSSY